MSEIYEEDEFECGCIDECDVPKPKKGKKRGIEEYLAVLRTHFDEVVYEPRAYEWYVADESEDSLRMKSPQYDYLCCRDAAVNQNAGVVEYAVWFEMRLHQEHKDWQEELLKYLLDNMKAIKQLEYHTVLHLKKTVCIDGIWQRSKEGMPTSALLNDHCGMHRPTAHDWADEMKRIIKHVFSEHALTEPDNPKFRRDDLYWFDAGPYWCSQAEIFEKEGVPPITLFQFFASSIRAYLGPNIEWQSEKSGETSIVRWLWSDLAHNWHDRNGYTFALDLINGTDVIEWLYGFTGWTRIEHDMEHEKMELLLAAVCRCDSAIKPSTGDHQKDFLLARERLIESARSARSAAELRARVVGHSKYNGYSGCSSGPHMGLLGYSSNNRLDKKMEIVLDTYPEYVQYLGMDETQFIEGKYGSTLGVFSSKHNDLFETLYDHYHPKPKQLELFSLDTPQSDILEPANRVSFEKAEPMTLFDF